jgi:hypothetical protein
MHLLLSVTTLQVVALQCFFLQADSAQYGMFGDLCHLRSTSIAYGARLKSRPRAILLQSRKSFIAFVMFTAAFSDEITPAIALMSTM